MTIDEGRKTTRNGSRPSWVVHRPSFVVSWCDNDLRMQSPQLERWQRVIVVAHVALAVLFGLVVPPYEAHDETGHFAYVNHLIATRSLPDASSDAKVFLDQSHQPPLYYLVVAGLTFWLDRGDQRQPETNLFAFDGTNRRGTRILLRDPGETIPWSGAILALHAARLVSALMSGLMIWLISKTARRLFIGIPAAALLTTAIAAFNPQVLFMAGMVNNDVMVSLAGAWLVYLLIGRTTDDERRMTDRSTGETTNYQLPITNYILIGIALALCLWSKNSSLILIPFTAVALLYLARRQRWPLRALILRGTAVGLAALVIAAPLYISNFARYGRLLIDRSADNPIFQSPTSVIGQGIDTALRDQWLPQIFVNAFRTFWGAFGWGNVQMPDLIYVVIAIFCLAGTIEFIIGLRRAPAHPTRDGLVLLAGLAVAMLLLPTYRAIYFQSPALLPGRYLMPALVAYAGILGYGWVALLSRTIYTADVIENGTLHIGDQVQHFEKYEVKRNLVGLVPLMCIAAGAFALAVPFLYIAPAYAPPAVQKTGAETPALLTFEDVAQVTAVTASTTYLSDREGARHYAHVHLTWRALQTAPRNYAFGISIVGRDAEVLGNLNVQPARGNFPTTNWQPGDTFEDDYDVLLEKPCPHLPALGQVSVTVYEYRQVTGDPGTIAISITRQLQARDGEGRAVAPLVGRFRIDAPAQPIPVFWQPPLGSFNGIALRGIDLPTQAQAGTSVTVNLTYEAWTGANPAGIAFVHLFDAAGQRVAQDDHAPLHGAYPTDLWQPGECVSDAFVLQVPVTATGTLRAFTGFYSPANGARFTTGTQDDLVPMGEVQVK
jgi:hypothetical protein